MKTLIGGIQKFSTEDGPGIRTSVFVKGCPLRCKWCHNPELISPEQVLMQSRNRCIGCGYCIQICPRRAISKNASGEIEIDRSLCNSCMKCADACYAGGLRAAAKPMSVDEIMEEVRKDKSYYEKTGGGVTLSGGEITSHPAFAAAMLDACRKEGIPVALDTCGFAEYGVLRELAAHPACRTVLYDLKSMDDEIHRAYTGVSNRLILENLGKLSVDAELREKILIRLPQIHGVNDTDGQIRAVGELMERCGLKAATLIPYHELGIAKSRSIGQQGERFFAPDAGRLRELARILSEYGVHAQILGENN